MKLKEKWAREYGSKMEEDCCGTDIIIAAEKAWLDGFRTAMVGAQQFLFCRHMAGESYHFDMKDFELLGEEETG